MEKHLIGRTRRSCPRMCCLLINVTKSSVVWYVYEVKRIKSEKEKTEEWVWREIRRNDKESCERDNSSRVRAKD